MCFPVPYVRANLLTTAQGATVVLPNGSRALSEGDERQKHTHAHLSASVSLFGLLCPSEQVAKLSEKKMLQLAKRPLDKSSPANK